MWFSLTVLELNKQTLLNHKASFVLAHLDPLSKALCLMCTLHSYIAVSIVALYRYVFKTGYRVTL